MCEKYLAKVRISIWHSWACVKKKKNKTELFGERGGYGLLWDCTGDFYVYRKSFDRIDREELWSVLRLVSYPSRAVAGMFDITLTV